MSRRCGRNRLTQHDWGLHYGNTWHTSSYDAANRLVTYDGTPLGYDANGSLVTYGTDTYSWDVRNRMVGLNRTGGTPVTASFVYDFLGRRTSKTINGATTRLLNDGESCVSEYDGNTWTWMLQGNRSD